MFLLIVSRQLTASRSCSPRHVPAHCVTLLLTTSLSCLPCHCAAHSVTFLLTMSLSRLPCNFPAYYDAVLLSVLLSELTMSLLCSRRHSPAHTVTFTLTRSLPAYHVILLFTTSFSCSPHHFPAHRFTFLLTTSFSTSLHHFFAHRVTFLITTSPSCSPHHFPAHHVIFLLITSPFCSQCHFPAHHVICWVAACVGRGGGGVYVGRGGGEGVLPVSFRGSSPRSVISAPLSVSSPTGHSVATASLSTPLCSFADHPRLAVNVVVFHCIIESTHLKLRLPRCRLCWLFKKALRPILTSVDVSTQAFSVK